MKKILIILLLQMAIAFNVFAQGDKQGDRIVNPTWKLSSGALTPTVSTWTLTLPATTFSPSIVTPLIIGGADTISTLTYKTTTGVGKTGARHIFQVGNNGATEAMTILNSGFVGVGTPIPGYRLDVSGNVNIPLGSYFKNNTNSMLGIPAGGGAIEIGWIGQGGNATRIGFGGIGVNDITFTNANIATVTIKNGGDLGLGTATPLHKLSGYSTTATNLNAFNFVNNTINKVTSTVAQAIDTSSFSLNFSSLGSPKLSLKGKTGNSMIYVDSVGVGIRTTEPASVLEVAGTTGFTWAAGGTATTRSRGLVTIGDAGAGGSLFINTASLNSTYPSGLAIDGSYTTLNTVVNLKATGAYGGGGYNSAMTFYTTLNTTATEWMRITNLGNVGLGTTSPTNLLSFGGNAARKMWMERHTTANTAGNNLTIQSGGATATATDKNGGDLILSSGTATGTGSSKVSIYTATAASTGTADNAPTVKVTVLGSGYMGIGTVTPTNLFNVNGAYNYFTDSSSVNDSWGFATTAITAMTAGMQIFVNISVANTDGATLQINALGAKAVLKRHDTALATGDVEVGQIIHLIYDGTYWQMLSQLAQ